MKRCLSLQNYHPLFVSEDYANFVLSRSRMVLILSVSQIFFEVQRNSVRPSPHPLHGKVNPAHDVEFYRKLSPSFVPTLFKQFLFFFKFGVTDGDT